MVYDSHVDLEIVTRLHPERLRGLRAAGHTRSRVGASCETWSDGMLRHRTGRERRFERHRHQYYSIGSDAASTGSGATPTSARYSRSRSRMAQ